MSITYCGERSNPPPPHAPSLPPFVNLYKAAGPQASCDLKTEKEEGEKRKQNSSVTGWVYQYMRIFYWEGDTDYSKRPRKNQSVGLSAFSLVFNNLKHALLSWDQVTNLAFEEYPISLPPFFAHFLLGRVWPCTPHKSWYFCHQSHNV